MPLTTSICNYYSTLLIRYLSTTVIVFSFVECTPVLLLASSDVMLSTFELFLSGRLTDWCHKCLDIIVSVCKWHGKCWSTFRVSIKTVNFSSKISNFVLFDLYNQLYFHKVSSRSEELYYWEHSENPTWDDKAWCFTGSPSYICIGEDQF